MKTKPGAPRQAVVLAAGEGRRLRPLTFRTPKVLIPFLGRPPLDRAVERLVASGVERVAVNAHHLAEQVVAHVERVLAPRYPQVHFHLSVEPELLGTGGAVRHLGSWIAAEPLWVLNADAVFAQDLSAVAAAHAARPPEVEATLMVTRDPALETLRRLALDDRGELAGLYEPWDARGAVFCGLQIASPALVERLPEGPSCNLRQGYLPWLGRGVRVGTFETRAFWADLGTLERIREAEGRAQAAGLADR